MIGSASAGLTARMSSRSAVITAAPLRVRHERHLDIDDVGVATLADPDADTLRRVGVNGNRS